MTVKCQPWTLQILHQGKKGLSKLHTHQQRSPAAGQWRHRRVGHVDVDVDEGAGVGREVEAVLVGHETVDDGVGAAAADEELGVLGVGEGAAVVVMSLPP